MNSRQARADVDTAPGAEQLRNKWVLKEGPSPNPGEITAHSRLFINPQPEKTLLAIKLLRGSSWRGGSSGRKDDSVVLCWLILNQPLLDDGFLWKMGSTPKIALSNRLIAKQSRPTTDRLTSWGGGHSFFPYFKS